MNRVEDFADVFDGVAPFAGHVPEGYIVDCFGTLIDARFHVNKGEEPPPTGGDYQEWQLYSVKDGEGWFEAVNWVLAAREARGRCVMMTLGAGYGHQAAAFYRLLQRINPMPCTLVAVEPEPQNLERVAQHFRDNGIDPGAHWLVPHALNGTADPVLFPIGVAGTGAQNCFCTNADEARRAYADQFAESGRTEPALYDLLLRNTTGLTKELWPGAGLLAEIKLVSAITLRELLGPFGIVDYIEADLQQSEINVFPPFIDLLRQKVRRIHIGTHGDDAHRSLHDLFQSAGWQVVFSFEPNRVHETTLGTFETNDGVLTVRNPDF